MLGAERLTHWSLPVKNLAESEVFYRDFLGLEYCGNLGGPHARVPRASVFRVGESSFIIWETGIESDPRLREAGVHYAFTVLPEVWDRAVLAIHEAGLALTGPIVYRSKGTFNGREIYVLDPSGNTIELTDPTWVEGMPEPTFEEIVGVANAS
jgi:catechol 2,3-dioxygenase-like lactoylglutathione lyase family enzyme